MLRAPVKLHKAIRAELVAALQFRIGQGLAADTTSVFLFICFESVLDVLQKKTEAFTVSFGISLGDINPITALCLLAVAH